MLRDFYATFRDSARYCNLSKITTLQIRAELRSFSWPQLPENLSRSNSARKFPPKLRPLCSPIVTRPNQCPRRIAQFEIVIGRRVGGVRVAVGAGLALAAVTRNICRHRLLQDGWGGKVSPKRILPKQSSGGRSKLLRDRFEGEARRLDWSISKYPYPDCTYLHSQK
jgi:hypothetical protein